MTIRDPYGNLLTHSHLQSHSADCDGRYTRTSVEMPRVGQTWREAWSELVARELTYLPTDRASVVRRDDAPDVHADGPGWPRFQVWQDTDEGYSLRTWTACSGTSCADERPVMRDHRAEAAGY